MSTRFKHIDIEELPMEVRGLIKKEHGIPTRKHNLTKDEVRGYAIKMLGQVYNLSKSDIERVLAQANKMVKS